MKRLKAMSNREWVQKHYPEKIGEEYAGGVHSCPFFCKLEVYKTCDCNAISGKISNKECTACWGLPAKRNGKYILKFIKGDKTNV